jgi:hypothetical protein
MYCVSSMQDIWAWFMVKYGFGMTSNISMDVSQTRLHSPQRTHEGSECEDAAHSFTSSNMLSEADIAQINKRALDRILKMEGDKKWDEYYELIDVIAKI